MLKVETVAFFLTVLSFCIATSTTVWKMSASLATMKAELRELIFQSQHELDAKTKEMGHIDDKLMLGINGAMEIAQHVRERTDRTHEQVSSRITDIELFLSKHLQFERRK
ncbi:MAG: hypothetical protein KME13_13105 [Myxacorys californica WJT36-NPBG1]|jgi:hypothetical protein|nr:hypothetical protein [Myxacorys californica WJT36-NPBG1]